MAIAREQQNNVIQLRPANDATQGQEVDQSKLKRHQDRFRESETHHAPMRELAFRDEDYYHNYDNDQWSAAEKALLRERGQPISTHNEIKRKVNFLRGMEQRGRTDPKAYPRTPTAHEKMAKVATDILVYIDDKTQLDKVFSKGSMGLLIHGIEACEVISKAGENETPNIPYQEFFYDPMSREDDFSDAKYLGYARWFDKEDAEGMYPEGKQYLHEAEYLGMSDSFEDRPQYLITEGNRKRVRIVVMYYRDGDTWNLTHFTGGGVLYEQVSPYHDEDGNPHCAIQAQSLYIDRENRRYGVVRDMIGPQDEVNHNRSKIWALANNRRTWARPGIVNEVSDFKTELAAIDGHLEVNGEHGQDWGFIDNTAEISDLAQLLANAQATLSNQGPNSGLRGRGTEGQSGIAIQAQQDAGMTEENSVFDGHKDYKLRVYKANFARAKQFWKQPKFLRVVTPEGEEGEQFVGINQPLTDQLGRPIINPRTGQPAIKNALGDMDVEIILDAVPDTVNLQVEQFGVLAELVKAGVQIPPVALIQASQLRDKDKIINEMNGSGGTPEEQAQRAQAAQMQQQLQVTQVQLELEKMKNENADKAASARLKAAQTQKVMAEVPKVQAETQETIVETRLKPTEAAHRMASADDARRQPQNA